MSKSLEMYVWSNEHSPRTTIQGGDGVAGIFELEVSEEERNLEFGVEPVVTLYLTLMNAKE